MSISWEGFAGISARRPATLASAGKGLPVFRQGGQHHEHQLGMVCRYFGKEASIMSISWEGFGGISATRPAS